MDFLSTIIVDSVQWKLFSKASFLLIMLAGPAIIFVAGLWQCFKEGRKGTRGQGMGKGKRPLLRE